VAHPRHVALRCQIPLRPMLRATPAKHWCHFILQVRSSCGSLQTEVGHDGRGHGESSDEKRSQCTAASFIIASFASQIVRTFPRYTYVRLEMWMSRAGPGYRGSVESSVANIAWNGMAEQARQCYFLDKKHNCRKLFVAGSHI